MPATIFVLAGVNGAGKSSIGGAALEASGTVYYNPDLAARTLKATTPALADEQANGLAWEQGRKGLERALANELVYAFETTLGAKTLSDMLLAGAQAGAAVHIWYAGLTSPELHIERVRSRVQAGGHPIDDKRIRARFDSSRANLIRLLPYLASLHVYDNSVDADPKRGHAPKPVLLLHMIDARVTAHAPVKAIPNWAKPILLTALTINRALK